MATTAPIPAVTASRFMITASTGSKYERNAKNSMMSVAPTTKLKIFGRLLYMD